jgi:hypothetical protein
MKSTIQVRTFPVYKVMLALVAIVASPSGVAAQDSASDRAFFPPVDVRLEVAAPTLLTWGDTSAVAGREWNREDSGGAALARTLENRRPLFSARGAAYGAAIGCAVGAVVYYDPEIPEISQRLAWSGLMCALLAIPGATFGAIWIR